MAIELLSPTGQVKRAARLKGQSLDCLKGKRLGYVFNQHGSTRTFWEALESEAQKALQPAAVERVYKDNTWAAAPQADIERLVHKTDYVLVGVGA